MLAAGNSSAVACSRNLLATMQREVPWRRSKGIDPDVVDTPLDDAEGYLDEAARDALGDWEPRVDVEGISIAFGEAPDGSAMRYDVTITDAAGGDGWDDPDALDDEGDDWE